MEIPSEYVIAGIVAMELIKWIGSKSSFQSEIFKTLAEISKNLKATADTLEKMHERSENSRVSKATRTKEKRPE
jgi:hypothetical protein